MLCLTKLDHFITHHMGGGCSSVGRAVVSPTRGTKFEYIHQQILSRTSTNITLAKN